MDPKDLARDTSGTRAYAAFVVEMAERVPNAVLPSISLVMGLLDGEVQLLMCKLILVELLCNSNY